VEVDHRSQLAGALIAGVAVAAITLLLYPLRELDPGVSSGVLYLVGVLLVAIRWGLWLGIATSLTSAAAIEYFHASQNGDPLTARPGDLMAVAVLLLTAIIASVLADRARTRADDAEERLELQRELRRRDAERAHLQEVRASRSRVIQAADTERRRVVRDLHDGAQQSLVHTVLTLRLAESEVDPGHPVAGLVAEALGHAERATTELRELVHGILPAALTRSGLRTALSSLASRMPLPVTVTAPSKRFPPPIEATAYFVTAEALTNVVKHARAGSATVAAREDAHRLVLEISDDGVGGATTDGTGLTGLADRLAAHDGTLAITSPPGRGTRLVATLPVS
jgi:signal transduction histidine kinase